MIKVKKMSHYVIEVKEVHVSSFQGKRSQKHRQKLKKVTLAQTMAKKEVRKTHKGKNKVTSTHKVSRSVK